MALNFAKGTTFMFLTGMGIAGNTFVLVSYIYVFRGSEKKPIHLILIHLVSADILMLFTKGTPRTIASFGLRNLGDVGCKMVVYLERVARGLSISTTSLLTVVQAITISPRASRWGRLQPRSAWRLLPLLLFCWILNSLISMNLPFYIKSTNSLNTSEFSESDNYCYFIPENWIIGRIFTGLMVFRDAVFQGVMGGASGHMVFLLHKHHQQVLHLQTSKLLHRTPPEVKAAKSVLLLMLCFLFFYWADCFVSLCSFFSLLKDCVSGSAHEFLTVGYAIVSPFLLIHRDGYLVESCRAQRKKNFEKLSISVILLVCLKSC